MSIRDISTLNQAAINAKVVRPILFGRFAFASGVKRMHTEIGPRTAVHPVYGSELYFGIGDFGGITANISESLGSTANPLRLGLSGINATLVSDALTDDYHGRDAELMFGFDDENGDLLDDPVILWSGYMDKVDISFSQGKAEMTLTCESRATVLQGFSDIRFTDEQLQYDYPGDVAGEYIYRMLDMQLKWGGGQVTAAPTTRWASSG